MDWAYLCFIVLGSGALLPWNALITASDYWALRFPGQHTDRLLTVTYLTTELLVVLVMIATHRRVRPRLRVTAGLLGFSAGLAAVVLMDAKPPSGHALAALLALVAVCGACDGLVSGALFGEAAVLAPRYTQALTAGNSLSGICVALLRAATKATLPDTESGLRQSANIYFSIAAAACLACLFLHAAVLPQLATVRSRLGTALEASLLDSSDDLAEQRPEAAPLLGPGRQRHERHEGGGGGGGDSCSGGKAPATAADVLRCIWVLGLSNILIFIVTLSIFPGVLAEDLHSAALGDWYPIALIAAYNTADSVGKALPGWRSLRLRSPRAILAAALARAAFIPAFRAAAVLHAGPPLLLVLTAALGTSNGFACACAMMAAPAAAPPGAASLAGNVMVLCVVLGLCLGAGASFLWLLAPPA